MKRVAILIMVLALCAPFVVRAGEMYPIAPVQIEILAGDRQYSYDCYPAVSQATGYGLAVYLNTPTGVAVYACDLAGNALIIPIVPRIDYDLAGLFETAQLEGNGA